MSDRTVRIAALGDFHFDERARGSLSELFDRVSREADVLAMVGDLTTHGDPSQMEAFLSELASVRVPVVTVLGNHDHEHGAADELCDMLAEAGVTVLDGNAVVLEGVGFAGVKGFAGGFGRRALGPFGESLIKAFVQEALDEALKLERALHELHTEEKVVLLHYAPVADTVEGEPEQIYPFLGSSRLVEPIEMHGADIVFHGHAHFGSYRGETPAGIPVRNVAMHVLEREGLPFHLHEAKAPDRRSEGEAGEAGETGEAGEAGEVGDAGEVAGRADGGAEGGSAGGS